ncbi:DUF2815 family protein [Paenibacillus caseinilyticus]|uniref:DUF2815 family protein n=1 Tax=Paenibacillus caseinilyticus TaxID=3098138 RepID=UPI0022B8D422|nr:DUF2815 family protein [Paenibacillus caseinilyticus]MCZ8518865.1 DUF2815 family protein [Paenibacillus caseinilyticus]
MTTTNKDTKVITGKVRFSYVHVFKPQAMEDGQDPKYSVTLLIPKSDKDTLKKIQAATNAAIEAGKSKWGGKIPPNLKKPLRDGDAEKDTEMYPEYAGHYFLNCSSKQKPGIVDRDRNEILDSTEVYSGCYGRVSLNFYTFDAKGNRGVAAGLNNLQKLHDGDYLGGRSSAADDFGDDVVDISEEDFLN